MDYMKMIDLSGMNPVMMQNNQSAQAQQAMQYGNQLANQALTGSGFSPQQMANALRQTNQPTQLSDAQKAEISQLGSNSWNPYSDYNRGTNGFGNYGE
jgi:hypothetical protein